MSTKSVQHPDYAKTITFSGKSTLSLNGNVNIQNVKYWSDRNPQNYREIPRIHQN